MSDAKSLPLAREPQVAVSAPMKRSAALSLLGKGLLAASSASLAACGGGGSGSPATEADMSESRILSSTPTSTGVSRFLSQAAWGGTDAAIADVQSRGYGGWLDYQFTVPSITSNYNWMVSKGFNTQAYALYQNGLQSSIWRKLISSPGMLRQRMVLALSEIFVVSPIGMPIPYSQFACAGYLDMLEAKCFGNFRQLLESVTLSVAMGVYLNLADNEKGDPTTGRQPDENYAREVMQLFTIGLYMLNQDGTLKLDSKGQPVETYQQSSVEGMAKALTGWRFISTGSFDVVNNPLVLDPTLHSSSEKDFLGVVIPAGTDGNASLKIALDTLFNHPNVAPFFCKQLIQRFVTSNPSPAYVGRISAVFNNNGKGVRGDLQAVVRALLLDSEASATPTTTSGKLREPMVRLVQWARTFGATSPTDAWNIGDTSDPATQLGQSPLQSRSVFNFFRPGYIPPNTPLATKGLLAPEMQLVSETSVLGYINTMQSIIAQGAGEVKSYYANELQYASNASALVARYNLLLAGGQLSATSTQTIVTGISTIAAGDAWGQLLRVGAAILLVMSSPEYLVMK